MSYLISGLSRAQSATVRCLALLAFITLVSTARAADISWTNTAGGNWSAAANWSPNVVPGAGDTALIVSNGTYTVIVDVSVTVSNLTVGAPSGLQTVSDSSQNIVITGIAAINGNGVFSLAGGNLAGGILVTGTFNWLGGGVGNPNGALIVASNGVLNITGGTGKTLYQPLTNYGTVAWSGGNLQVWNNTDMGGGLRGSIYNMPGGLFDIQNDLNVFNTRVELFSNAGTVRKSGGTDTANIYIPFDNDGTVEVLSGNLVLRGGGRVTGQYNASSGTGIYLAVGSFTQTGTPVFGGSGVRQFVGTSLTLTTDQIPGLTLAEGSVYLAPTFQGGSITNLTLAGGNLVGTNTVTGTFNWLGGGVGSPYGALTVASNGLVNITGGAGKTLYQPLTNYGTVAWSGGGLTVYNNTDVGGGLRGLIYNATGALFDIQNDLNVFNTRVELFSNAGTVRKSGGAGVAYIYIPFDNDGTVEVLSGSLVLRGGGRMTGQYNASSGAGIYLTGGSFTQVGTPVFGGSGVRQLVGASLTLTTDQIPGLTLADGYVYLGPMFQGGSITNLTLAGGNLVGTNTVTGTFNWLGGGVGSPYGALTVASNGLVNITGGAGKTLYQPLTNYGTVAWNGGALTVYNNTDVGGGLRGLIYNATGALFDIQNDLNVFNTRVELFSNAGTVRKSGGTDTANIYIPFDNDGTVEVLSGSLVLRGGGRMTGQYNASSGAGIYLTGGSFTQVGTPVFGGSGVRQLVGASLTLTTDQIPGLTLADGYVYLGPMFQGGSITNLTLAGGNLVGTNTVTGTFNWLGGGVGSPYGALTVASNGVVNITGGAGKTLYQPLTNYGTVAWNGGALTVYNNTDVGGGLRGMIYNAAGGLFDIQNDLNVFNTRVELFSNAGTVRKSGGAGVAYIYIPFDNDGTVEVLSGSLVLRGGGRVTGQYNASSGAGIYLTVGSFTQVGTPVFGGSGVRQLVGASLTLTTDQIPGLTLADGYVYLGSTFQGGSITNLTLAGANLVGTNTVTGTFNWLGGGVGNPNGALTVASNGVVNISGGVLKTLYQPLTNYGTVAWNGGGLTVYNNTDIGGGMRGMIYNAAGALFDIQSDLNVFNTRVELFSNAGTVRKSGGAGVAYIYIPFDNDGTVEVLSGSLVLRGGGRVTGQYNASSGAGIYLTVGSFTQVGTPVFGGSGVRQLVGASLTLTTDQIPGLTLADGYVYLGSTFQGGSITNLTLAGANLVGTNTVTGTFNWLGGGVGNPNGALTVASNGVVNISGGTGKTLYQPLTNYGTVAWSGGSLQVWNNTDMGGGLRGSIYNMPGALFDIQSDLNMFNTRVELFSNAGTVRKSGGAGIATSTFHLTTPAPWKRAVVFCHSLPP